MKPSKAFLVAVSSVELLTFPFAEPLFIFTLYLIASLSFISQFTLLNNGKTIFAVSRDEVIGYNTPYPCITPNNELLDREVNHCIRNGAYAYFIELPMNIE
ncbi:MAG: hypothetical protein IJN29_05695 [Akkermansia sp.]|nr:hypothetical protein [Akkermansia sp.]